jgi:hypothetical protein
MRTLRIGDSGNDVKLWETFLVGQDPTCGLVVDQTFDDLTKELTTAFQLSVGLKGLDADGIVGPKTYGKAMDLGFDPVVSTSMDEGGPNWPPRPKVDRMDLETRRKVFGNFAFEPAPTKGSPEAIRITDGWAKSSIKLINIPQLVGVKGAPVSGNVEFHAKAAAQLQKAFAAIEAAGLKHLLLSWGGSWVPRYIRGSRRTLSNHAWGTAFDINMEWNALGTRPALKGRVGSTRELVSIFEKFGFFWGGWYGMEIGGGTAADARPDGMHFECMRVL